MFCRNCGEEMNDNQAICLKCGVEKDKGDKFCPNCGSPITAEEAVICVSCGVALNKTKGLGKYDKLTMALICFFLGGLGIHNFMMGENKRGIGKIIFFFVCGISGILALIDFIKILLDKYEINTEKMF